jgi:hypothetical protein
MSDYRIISNCSRLLETDGEVLAWSGNLERTSFFVIHLAQDTGRKCSHLKTLEYQIRTALET